MPRAEILSIIKAQAGTLDALCVASKYANADQLRGLYAQGCHCFGENRLQDAIPKMEALADLDIDWHFIGHLQTNKVKKVVSYFNWIQSVDTLELATQISKQAAHINKPMMVLVQVNIAKEPQKHGVLESELPPLLSQIAKLPFLTLRGLMAMTPDLEDPNVIKPIFKSAKSLFDRYQSTYGFDTLSMGMSQDFEWALQEGSTMVRVGRALFCDSPPLFSA